MQPSVLTTPPLAPTVIACLAHLGINNKQQLLSVGAEKAFLLLKASGLTVTRSVLWQLWACAHDCSLQDIDNDLKKQLCARVAAHPPVRIFPAIKEMNAFMSAAIIEAKLAMAQNEVPVGAVIVYQGEVIAAAHNQCIENHWIGAHAELRAMQIASARLKNYRLDDCDLYTTLEPCPMCAGAIVQARISRLIIGCAEPKSGAAGSLINLFENTHLNSHTAVLDGVMTRKCQHLLQQFFSNKRCTTKT